MTKNMKLMAGTFGVLAFASAAYAVTFGAQVNVSNVKVKNIWSGR